MKWLFASIVPLFLISSAQGDCVSECQAATYCDSEMHASGECARKLNDCYIAECSRPSKTYGAIAYDAVSGAVGWSYDFTDAPGAEREALANCAEHGEGCKPVLDFWNSCAALAAGDGGHFTTGLGDTREEAEAAAMAECTSAGGGKCAINAWSCTRR